MKVIVTGGRAFVDHEMVARTLSAIPNLTTIIEGGALGADRLCREWALANGVGVVTVEAQWEKFGKRAGHIRNSQMLKQFPDAYVCYFPGGRGTMNCVQQAVEGLRTLIKAE